MPRLDEADARQRRQFIWRLDQSALGRNGALAAQTAQRTLW
jgi:hypothetical protein